MRQTHIFHVYLNIFGNLERQMTYFAN